MKAADCHESPHQSRDTPEAHLPHSRCHIQLYFVHPMWHFCTKAKKVLLLQDELLPRGTVLAWRCAAGDPERKEKILSLSRLLPLDLFLVFIMFVLYDYQVVTVLAVRLHNSSIHSPWACGNYWFFVKFNQQRCIIPVLSEHHRLFFQSSLWFNSRCQYSSIVSAILQLK